MTATDEMDFDSIGKEKTAVFLIIPAARQTYKAIANIFYSQLFERLMFIANRDYNGRLPNIVSCEMDEFANIGTIPNFNETLSVVRSYNIRICIVLQGLSQLKALYEKKWESIIGNCSIFNFLGTNDQDSKEYVAKKLGKTTVRVDNRSYNRGGKNGGGGSESESYIQRDLLAPDEISQVIKPNGKTKRYGGNCIVFVDEFKPFFLCKYDTMSHPLFPMTGSSFSNGIPNNTNITEVYAPLKQQRHEHHQQVLTDFFAKSQDEAEQAIAEAEAEEAAEQERLREMFPDELFSDGDFYDDSEEDIKISEDEFNELEVQEVNPIVNNFKYDEKEGDDE
jgi:type IV secretion system protein VirD4